MFLLFLHISMTFEVSCLLHYFDVNIIIINIYHLLTSRVIAATHPVSVQDLKDPVKLSHTWLGGGFDSLLTLQ